MGIPRRGEGLSGVFPFPRRGRRGLKCREGGFFEMSVPQRNGGGAHLRLAAVVRSKRPSEARYRMRIRKPPAGGTETHVTVPSSASERWYVGASCTLLPAAALVVPTHETGCPIA